MSRSHYQLLWALYFGHAVIKPPVGAQPCRPGFQLVANIDCIEVASGGRTRLREQAAAHHGDETVPQRGDSAVPAHENSTMPDRENATGPGNGSATASHRGVSTLSQRGISALPDHGNITVPHRGVSTLSQRGVSALPDRWITAARHQRHAPVSRRGLTAVPRHGGAAAVPGQWSMAAPGGANTDAPGHWSSPEPGSGNMPDTISESTSVPGHEHTPGPGIGHTPESGLEHIPQPDNRHKPGPGIGHTPEPGIGHTPEPGNGHTPEPGIGHTTGPGIGRTPELGIGRTPEPGIGRTPEPGIGRTPEPGIGHTPEPSNGHTPEPGIGHTPEPVNRHTPEPGIGHTPEPGNRHTPEPGIGHTPEPGNRHTPEPESGPAAPTARSRSVTAAREPGHRLPSTAPDPLNSTAPDPLLTTGPHQPHSLLGGICAGTANTSRLLDKLCPGAGIGLPPEDVIAYSRGLLAGRWAWAETPREERIEAASRLLSGVEEAALSWGSVGPNHGPRTIASAEMDLQVVRVDGAPAGDRVRLQAGGNMAEVGWTTGTNTSGSAVVALIVYGNMETILQGALYSNEESGHLQGHFQLHSKVVSAALRISGNSSTSVAVMLVLKHQQAPAAEGKLSCVYWSQAAAWHGWSTRGCALMQSNSTHTTCQCQHLSSFAILMAFTEKLQSHRQDALSVISFIGIPVSLTCLLLALATFTFCPQARNAVSATHAQLCLSLFLAELLFIVGINRTANRVVCGMVAGCLHYLFLAAFAWMSLESAQLYVMVRNLKKMRVSSSGRTGKLVYAAGYGCPALVVTLSALIHPDGYGSQRNCWLQVENGFIWSFLGPVYLIILINTFLFTTSLYTLNKELSNRDMKVSKIKDTRMLMFKAIGQVFILGCTWILGLFHFQEETLVMAYLFTIVNSFQGTFIFIILCILNPKIRAEYQKWIFAISQTKRMFFESESTKTPLSVTSVSVLVSVTAINNFSGRHGGAAVELLPHSAGDPGSIPTTGAVCTEFVRSPRDLRGFSPRSSVSL
ncbi:adhesion G protein-coupled receptor E1-like isoform X2 [Rhinoraja longicauda]